jgi:hypothetical protein
LGKGAALKTGCDYAFFKRDAEIVVAMDADGQHKAEDVLRLINTIKSKKLDVVFGGRKIDKNMPFVLKIGNLGLSLMTRIMYGVKIDDTQSGFRAFTKKAYSKIRWISDDYSMESEMIARISKHKLKYYEIPIKTIYLDRYKGTTVLNGIKIGLQILLWKIKRL